MATKEELIAFAESHGIDVDSSMVKADIESAISDAGYDPNTLEESTVSDEPEAEQTTADPSLSRNAEFSTYTEVAPQQLTEQRPPPGRQVQQELGTPSESTE